MPGIDRTDKGQNSGSQVAEASGGYIDGSIKHGVESSSHLPLGTLNNASGQQPTSHLSEKQSIGSLDARQRGPAHQNKSPLPGAATPPGRRSVQFARPESETEAQELSRSRASSLDEGDGDPLSKDRKGQSLFSKLKSFAATSSFPASHSRSASAITVPISSADGKSTGDVATPVSERGEFHFPSTLEEEGSEADADAEESASEQRSDGIRKKKRKARRPQHSVPQTVPSTPKATSRPPLYSSSSFTPVENFRPNFFLRRATTPDAARQARDGVSEDEGRDRLNRDNAWRRRSAWMSTSRALNYGSARHEARHSQDERRGSNLRRLTGLAPPESAEGLAASWRRHRPDRGSSLSAQKWRQIKAGFKMIAQRRKAESTVDHVKSAELLAELTSGIPAALLLASMFQRDEHGSRRIPILLEQLKVQVTDSELDSHSGDRHLVFRIELEYGSGITRMKWVIHRTLRDFANLHLKYKLHFGTQKYIQLRSADSGQGLPRFPRSAFPYLRGVRGLESDGEDEEDDAGYETEGNATSGNEKSGKKKKRRSSAGLPRRQSSLTNQPDNITASGAFAPTDGVAGSSGTGAAKKETYPEKQRKKLESYLQKMIRALIFRPDSNRLCKFLELSALGVRLAAEGSYHGKEGFLMIQSSKGLDFRKALNPSLVKHRHAPKWFLVRHSYVVCVDSPEEMHIYDVFLVDPFFNIQTQKVRLRDQKAKELAKSAKESAAHPKHHTLKIQNSERKLRLLARNERQLHQFEDSIRFMVDNTPWSKPNRFDSFAPVRPNCFAQWLVDGRDHMWVVSRAINQAKDVIYIHDWWLSPELYMRRPAAISQKWRLDRLLRRKAEEGVKVFVIMYRNINSAIPIDSEYSKFSLLDLHPNVFVQRSPNQFRQNTFFWAHHEKLCIVDHTLAFVGGIDLCFGRWDTPQHLVTDDKLTGFEEADMPKDADHCQLWPGKDYSNPRVQDFYDLDKPYEEMYDRAIIPRMPWHDISMHVVGQPARDLTRHFVQRWNYILRQRKPTRPTPFLLPPPDFNPADLEALGLDGTCEVQILRSSSVWSTGTPDVTEHSIMNAYVKLIEQSEHFVYIENQFYISSCEIEGKKIENTISDALVERIIRASRNEENWRAVILIPLMPGFQNTVDTEGGTSVRLIMQCQYRSICRGETSIFGRLRAHGIEPEDYIQFFSLRTWGKIGPQKRLVTEQLYIHAKCMIVDDRAAIIGSANINERSMLGSRDSECAAVVRDTDMLWSTMNSKPYLVGRFPHTLRMRLMREHLGIDVDEVMGEDIATEAELRKEDLEGETGSSHSREEWVDPEAAMMEKQNEKDLLERRHRIQDEFLSRSENMSSFNHDVDWEQANNPNLKANRKLTSDSRVIGNSDHKKDLQGDGVDQMNAINEAGHGDGRDTSLVNGHMEVLVSDVAPEGRGTLTEPKRLQTSNAQISGGLDKVAEMSLPPTSRVADSTAHQAKAPMSSQLPPLPNGDDGDIGGPSSTNHNPSGSAEHNPLPSDTRRPLVDKDCMRDPVNDAFYIDTWQTIAENNTKLYRSVFRCMPDSEVKSWKEYKEYTAYAERFSDMQNHHDPNAGPETKPETKPGSQPTGPPGTGAATSAINKTDVSPVPETEEEGEGMDLREQLVNAVTHNKYQESSPEEKLRHWASEANQAQIERQQTELDKQETRSSQSEEAALKRGNTAKSSNSHLNTEDTLSPGGLQRQRSGPQYVGYSNALNMNASIHAPKRRRRATTRGSKREFQASDDIIEMGEAEELLNMVQGHLILWPYEWYVIYIVSRMLRICFGSPADSKQLGWRERSREVTGCTLLTRSRHWRYSKFIL